jgi:hypothetical protein
MSQPNRPEPADAGCELAPVTCWPLIIAVASVAVIGIAVASGLLLSEARRPAVVPVASAPEPQPAPEPAPTVTLAPAELAPPQPRTAERVVTVKRKVVREYVPLPARPLEDPKEEKPAVVRLRRRAQPAAAPAAPPPFESWRRRLERSEVDLGAMLMQDSREIDLEAQTGAGKALLDEGLKHAREPRPGKEKAAPSPSSAIESLLKKRDDLKGLPLRAGKACQSGKEQTKVLGEVSAEVRPLQARADRRRLVRAPEYTRYPYAPKVTYEEPGDPKLKTYLQNVLEEVSKKELLVRPLEQMYQTEPAALRRELVTALGKIKGEEATQALARRAVFDLSPAVRSAAVQELRNRDLDEARPVFLEALRHPWAPAADHAAVALVALEDGNAVPDLRDLVDLPDPSAPYRNKDGKWVKKELVRVNHLRNCLLCHAPSANASDPVRGPIPKPGEPLPVVYYSSKSRLPSVRADVVYFRQDFSAMHKVARPDKWPAVQRFDYLVRQRELKPAEAKEAAQAARKKSYSQQEAVRYALALLEMKPKAEPRKRR